MAIILRPGLLLMNRLTYIWKFILTGFLLILPAGILMRSYLSQIDHTVQTTVSEQAGLSYYQPVIKLMQDVQRHRALTGILLDKSPAFNDQLKANEASLAADLQAVDTIDAQSSDKAGVSGTWSLVRTQWVNILTIYSTLTPQDNFDSHSLVISSLRNFLGQVANRSGLIIDPNLDSYYLIDLTTNVLPNLAENTSQINGLGTLMVSNQKAGVAELSGINSALNQAQTSLQSSQNSFDNIFKNLPDARQTLALQAQGNYSTVQSFIDQTNKALLGNPQDALSYIASIKPTDFYNQSTKPVDSIFSLYNNVQNELNAVLQQHIDAISSQRELVLVLVLLVLAVAVYLLYAFYVSVRRTITQLEDASRNLASGHTISEVVLDTRDELGQIASSFNMLASTLIMTNHSLIQRSDELEIANVKAREANRVKSNFLSTMSHELRTPLNAIVGFTDLMLTEKPGPLTEMQRMFLDRTAGNNRRLLSLINDILDLSRIEAGRIEVQLHAYSPREMIDRLVGQTSSLFSAKGLLFDLEVAPDVPGITVGDQARVEQIVVNLLSNAAKFTSAGTVQLSAQMVDPDHWSIAVSDTGRGIPPHLQDVIFEPFRQVDSSSTREVGGSGLGLAISRELALIMQGTLTVKSETNKGSTFTITLPIGDLAMVKLDAMRTATQPIPVAVH